MLDKRLMLTLESYIGTGGVRGACVCAFVHACRMYAESLYQYSTTGVIWTPVLPGGGEGEGGREVEGRKGVEP